MAFLPLLFYLGDHICSYNYSCSHIYVLAHTFTVSPIFHSTINIYLVLSTVVSARNSWAKKKWGDPALMAQNIVGALQSITRYSNK